MNAQVWALSAILAAGLSPHHAAAQVKMGSPAPSPAPTPPSARS